MAKIYLQINLGQRYKGRHSGTGWPRIPSVEVARCKFFISGFGLELAT